MERRKRAEDPFDIAKRNLTRLRFNYISAMVKPSFTALELAHWVFPAEILSTMKAAFVWKADNVDGTTEFFTPGLGHGPIAAVVTINWNRLGMITPHHQKFSLYHGPSVNLEPVIHHVAHYHDMFKGAAALLEWFQERGSIAAARYAWPALEGLVGTSGAGPTPTPYPFGEKLQALRAAQTLVATALIIPEQPVRDCNSTAFSIFYDHEMYRFADPA
jgi:hypothetical protein